MKKVLQKREETKSMDEAQINILETGKTRTLILEALNHKLQIKIATKDHIVMIKKKLVQIKLYKSSRKVVTNKQLLKF